MKNIILCVTLLFSIKTIIAQQGAPMPEAAPAQEQAHAAPQAADQPAQPAQPAAPEVKSEQLTWPDTVDLTENASEVYQTNNPQVVERFKKAHVSLDKMIAIIDAAVKGRVDLYQKYFDLDAKLDEFLQNTSLDEGIIQSISPLENESSSQPASVSTSDFKKEFDQIKTNLDNVNATKVDLKKSLSAFDSEIEKGKSLVLQSQKKAIEILQQASQDGPQNILTGIEQDLATLTTMQDTILATATKEFQTAFDKIQAGIQIIQTLVSQMHAKQLATRAQAQPEPQTQPAPPTQSAAIPLPPMQQQATFPHYLLTRMTELCAGVIHVASSTYTTIRDALTKTKSAPIIPEPTPSQIPKTSPAVQAQPAPMSSTPEAKTP